MGGSEAFVGVAAAGSCVVLGLLRRPVRHGARQGSWKQNARILFGCQKYAKNDECNKSDGENSELRMRSDMVSCNNHL